MRIFFKIIIRNFVLRSGNFGKCCYIVISDKIRILGLMIIYLFGIGFCIVFLVFFE